MTLEPDQPDTDLIHRTKAIKALEGQKLEEVAQCSDPQVAEVIMQAWNEAVGDCISAIQNL
ncbi:MAG: hypothetical protein GY899_11690 [Verrucomicrobiaceae bacterium]|jgi:hypothetical protein|nr:hypothetical protein [Verrucomicrobiaceae bacterium]